MAINTFITPQWVTTDVAMNFRNSIRLAGQFNWEYSDEWKNKPDGAQIGYTVQARIPQRWVVNEGQALIQQPILNQTVPVSMTHQLQVGCGWSSVEATLQVEEVQSRYTKTSGRSLANKADVLAGKEVYKSVYFSIGTPGTAITSDETWTDGIAKLRNVGVPEPLCAVIDPKSQSKLLSANFAFFNPQNQISTYFKTGQFSGAALGADEWYWDPNIPTHTTGTFTTATPIVSSAGQTGSTLAMSGLGTYSMKAGDVFTCGVNSVNPLTFEDTGDLQQFVLTSDLAGTTTGTFNISPPIITSGPLQTVTASPSNNAPVSWLGSTGTVGATMATQTSRQSLLFHPEAFAGVTADLKGRLAGAESDVVSDPDMKISMRRVEQYNIQTDQDASRIDMLVGYASILPYFALRAWS